MRFDPEHIFEYVCDEEVDPKDITIFNVRPLTILQYTICRNVLMGNGEGSGTNLGTFSLEVVKFGLVGWKNFKYEDNGEDISFCSNNLNALSVKIVDEISRAILSLSEVDSKCERSIRFTIKWSEYVGKLQNPDQWNCDICTKKKLAGSRNCEGKDLRLCRKCKLETLLSICPKCDKVTSPKFILKLNNKQTRYANEGFDYVTRCPVRFLEPKIMSIINMATFIDEAGSFPVKGAALEQSNYYYQIRQMILTERNLALKDDNKQNIPNVPKEVNLESSRMGRMGK